MKKIVGIVFGVMLPFTAMAAQAVPSMGSLQAGKDYVEGEVLVIPAQPGAAVAASALGYSVMAAGKGKTQFLRLKLKPGQSTASAMSTLPQQSWAGYVQPNYIYHATLVPNDPKFAEQWGYQNTGQAVNPLITGTAGTSGVDISAVATWDQYTDCSSVTVAVIDSGVDYNHPDLAANMWTNANEVVDGTDTDGNGFIDDVRGWDFVQGDSDPMDFYAHGTHVAGTIGAAGNNGVGGTGVCWNASIMPVRVMNSVGEGTTADIVPGVDYAVANGAKIINMSLGMTAFDNLFSAAIDNANTAGVLVVAAAGNNGTDNDATAHYPASYTQANIISVAATDQNDALASFSNYGATSVDMAAPGVNILSTTVPVRTAVTGCNWNFASGTLEGWTPATYDNYGNPVANTVAVTTEAALTDSYSLTDSPGANYANNRIYTATSPACDLTGKYGAVLFYAYRADTEYAFDLMWMDASVDGVNWTASPPWSGTTNGLWYGENLDMQMLDNYATAQVRARLVTDGSVTLNGAYLDSIMITVPSAVHAGTEYVYMDGTSMAAPHVAGAAALVWAANPTLTVAELKNWLMYNGDSLAALAGKTVSGRRLNLQNAMTPPPVVVAAAAGGGGGCVLNAGAGFDPLFVLLLLSAAILMVRGRRRNGAGESGASHIHASYFGFGGR